MLKKNLYTLLLSNFFFIIFDEQKASANLYKCKKGLLTVICGAMCSGKSEELIKQLVRFNIAGAKVSVFKPSIDTRNTLNLDRDPLSYTSSRNGSWTECVAVNDCEEILSTALKNNADVVAIDEAMFFGDTKKFIGIIQKLLDAKKTIIVAGLDLNFRGEPFGAMPDLLAMADNVIKLTAICSVCKDDTYCLTQRLIDGVPAHYNDPLIDVGANQYNPRCRKCHILKKD